MNHLTLPRFWQLYHHLPESVQELADKKVGRRRQLWSVRVGEHYRALGTEKTEGIVWFWIGPHTEYDRLIQA